MFKQIAAENFKTKYEDSAYDKVTFNSPKMKYTSVIIPEALIIGHDLEEQPPVHGEIRNCCQQPTVSQLSLLNVESGETLHEKLGIIADFLNKESYNSKRSPLQIS